MNITKLIAIVAATIFLAACSSDPQVDQLDQKIVDVEVKKIELTSVQTEFQYAGKVISDNHTMLSTKLMGHIDKVYVDEGDKVKKGDLLVKIKSKEVQSKLAAAKSGLKEASSARKNTERNFERTKALFEKGSATQREFDDVSTALDMAKARVESIQENITELQHLLSYANLRSPIDGFVSQKFFNEGDLATPGNPILMMESLTQLKMEIQVPEFEIEHFEANEKVMVTINALNKKTFQGVVDNVVPSTATSGTQFKVTVVLTNPESSIKPGMFGRVKVARNAEEKIILPEEVLIRKGQLAGVYTLSSQNEALLRWLRLGKETANGFEVLSGLESGEMIVVSAKEKLQDGASINITKTL